jgi:hypothetical protein
MHTGAMGIGGFAQIAWRSSPRRSLAQIEMKISRSYATCRPYRVVGPDCFDGGLSRDIFKLSFCESAVQWWMLDAGDGGRTPRGQRP